MTSTNIIKKLFGINIVDKNERVYLALNNYLAFCLIYFSHYFILEPADFHLDLIKLLEDEDINTLIILGFRGSAKSTHASMAYPIWQSIRARHRFIILLSDTGAQSNINIKNIKAEFEQNDLLKSDFPLLKPENKLRSWTESGLEFTNNVYISGKSRGQRIRGLRYRQYRPSLIVGDDLESLEWVRFKANRDKTERWIKSEIIPAMEETGAKLIIIGNLLHSDGLMARLKNNELFNVIEFPLIDKKGDCTWRAKYPTDKSIKRQRRKVGETAWAREYLLKIISEDDQVIKETDIHRYPNDLLTRFTDYGEPILKPTDGGVGIDLAISEKQTADFTTMVSGIKALWQDKGRIFIKPNPINQRISYDATLKKADLIHKIMPYGTKFYVEDVYYQRAAIEGMKKRGIPTYNMRPITDKRARLETVAPFIIDGTVVFPEEGCEDLIAQLIGFGIEEHDDLVDALVYLIMGLTKRREIGEVERIDRL